MTATKPLIVVVSLAVLAGCSPAAPDPRGVDRGETPRTVLQTGRAAAVLIDGRRPSGDFHILVANGRISGGNDGCNGWGYDASGNVVSSLVGCPPDTERDRQAYWAVVRSARDLRAPLDERLVLKGSGHTVSFRVQPIASTGPRPIYVAVLARPREAYQQSRVDGVFDVRDGCAMLGDNLLVLVAGSSLTKTDDGWMLHGASGEPRRLASGDQVRAGGAVFPIESLGRVDTDLVLADPVPARCRTIAGGAALAVPIERIIPSGTAR